MSRNYGRVAWFSSKKGFGFITPLKTVEGHEKLVEDKTDVFLHYSNVKMKNAQFVNLFRREIVEFDLVWNEGKKSFIATNITGPWGEDLMMDEKKPEATASASEDK
jgi:cold shock CspA family protein